MSLDNSRPRTYVPLRLKSAQLQGFFNLLKHRKLNRIDADTTLQITDQPFEEQKPTYKTNNSPISKKRKVKSTVSGNKKKKSKLEAKINKVKF